MWTGSAITAKATSSVGTSQKVADIADEPFILFVFTSPQDLRLFAEAFAAQTSVCTRSIELHVKLDFGATVNATDWRTFASWTKSDLPHGRLVDAHGIFETWLLALQELPSKSTHVHLVFPYFWRDFRSLRGLAEKSGQGRCSDTAEDAMGHISGKTLKS
jgi:hypothetical protein